MTPYTDAELQACRDHLRGRFTLDQHRAYSLLAAIDARDKVIAELVEGLAKACSDLDGIWDATKVHNRLTELIARNLRPGAPYTGPPQNPMEGLMTHLPPLAVDEPMSEAEVLACASAFDPTSVDPAKVMRLALEMIAQRCKRSSFTIEDIELINSTALQALVEVDRNAI